MKLPRYTDPDGLEVEIELAPKMQWFHSYMFALHFVCSSPDFKMEQRTVSVPCEDKTCHFTHHYVLYDLHAHGERVCTLLGSLINSVRREDLMAAHKELNDAKAKAKEGGQSDLLAMLEGAQIPRGDFDTFICKKNYEKWINDPEAKMVNEI